MTAGLTVIRCGSRVTEPGDHPHRLAGHLRLLGELLSAGDEGLAVEHPRQLVDDGVPPPAPPSSTGGYANMCSCAGATSPSTGASSARCPAIGTPPPCAASMLPRHSTCAS